LPFLRGLRPKEIKICLIELRAVIYFINSRCVAHRAVQASILCGIAADRHCGRVSRCATGAASLHLPRLQQLHILLLHRGLIALDSLLADSPRLLRCMHLFGHRCARLCMCCCAVWLEFTDRKDNVEDALLTLCTNAAHIKAYLLGLLAMIKCSICSYQCDN
jgi:hypothetical protein